MAEHHGGVLVRQVRALGHLVPALGWVPWSWESQRASALARTTSGVPAGQPGGLPPPRPSPAMSAQPRRGEYLAGAAHEPPWGPGRPGPPRLCHVRRSGAPCLRSAAPSCPVTWAGTGTLGGWGVQGSGVPWRCSRSPRS
jgi:hypothetical protein